MEHHEARPWTLSAPRLDPAEERGLIARMQAGDEGATQLLVLAHGNLARTYARRYARRSAGVQFEDLVQEGLIGLLEAARRFDPERGVRFGSYARWWVQHRVHRFVQQNGRAVASPRTRAMRKLGTRYGRLRRAVEQQLGREVAASELAERLDLDAGDLAQVETFLTAHDSSFEALAETRGAFADPASETIEDKCAAAERASALRSALESCIDELGQRERRILSARHLSHESVTLRELGAEMGVSRERVRQLEQACLQKLARELAMRAEASGPGLAPTARADLWRPATHEAQSHAHPEPRASRPGARAGRASDTTAMRTASEALECTAG